MKNAKLQEALGTLSAIQKQAVDWGNGAVLVLAGPGTGKTRVLTCRIARLLDSSRDQTFRILALTFTNKAAHEMQERVNVLADGLTRRTYIGTFHGFCADVLRQHGSHVGMKPNFAIYAREADRESVLEDALRRAEGAVSADDMRLLPLIDDLKSRLITPDEDLKSRAIWKGKPPKGFRRVGRVYQLYEEELGRANAVDFNSLILKAFQLFGFEAFARHYRTVYRYWLIDEFQDTNAAQYQLLRRIAGEKFRNLFVVADDDQTIYEFNGASISRLSDLVRDYSCCMLQMPTSYRCPSTIVAAANRLLLYNARRFESKLSIVSARGESNSSDRAIQTREFETDTDESTGIAEEIADMDSDARERTVVLARPRALLKAMKSSLDALDVPSRTIARRDDFLSPEMRWLVACLNQIRRPLDRRNMRTLVDTYQSFAEAPASFEEIASRSAASEHPLLTVWLEAVLGAEDDSSSDKAVRLIAELAAGGHALDRDVNKILNHWRGSNDRPDLKDDLSAWRRVMREGHAAQGSVTLDRMLQALELQSKEPVAAPGSVTLATIHGAKGLEFDTVYLIGMAEEILPSWHSVNSCNGRVAVEEERRSCFVAVTRSKENLILSRAKRYNDYLKGPSRFLKEMQLA
ncbi:MAG: ATP-dependent helicase [Bacteroidota bacterium]|nr:ATP-dependent helicase [Bacteroidota bacterium]